MPEGAATSGATKTTPNAAENAQGELERALGALFGHSSFRDGQREIVETVLRGEDVLAILPTGAGKSLLYQLPAFLLPGVTVAVSPLIALMQDQLTKLRERGLAAAVLNSALSGDAQDRVLESVMRGETKLLLVAPERFRSARFLRALARTRVSLLAVDEAHCVSEWGHDFRPDYDRLGDAARTLGRPPILAVTATATERVRRDIAASLDLRPEHRVFIRGFDRPNLRFSVTHASGADKADAVLDAIQRAAAVSGSIIIYCSTRKSCEKLAPRLRPKIGNVLVYHAGLASEQRRRVQEAWQKGESRAVVATNAFGLGIDKQDVRIVVHHDLPGSLEAYYQEAGRAGRDGQPAECVLVFSAADVHLQTYLSEGAFPEKPCVVAVARELAHAKRPVEAQWVRGRIETNEWSERAVSTSLRLLEGAGLATSDGFDSYQPASSDLAKSDLPGIDWTRLARLRQHEQDKLARVLTYARASTCRRASILRYFGAASEATPGMGCGACDRCLAPAGDRLSNDEAIIVAKKVLSLVVRIRARFGRGVVARLLAGHVEPEDKQKGIAELPTIGALKPWSVAACAAAVDACLAHELLETYTEDGKYPKVRPTDKGVAVMLGKTAFEIAIAVPGPSSGSSRGKRDRKPRASSAASSAAPITLDAAGDRLLAELKRWRTEKAREQKVPPYCVFKDQTLTTLVQWRPKDLATLLTVPGIGSQKAERYGEALIALFGKEGAG